MRLRAVDSVRSGLDGRLRLGDGGYAWHANRKHGAAILVPYVDRAAHFLYGAEGHGQTKARTLANRFGGKEWLEHSRLHLGRNTASASFSGGNSNRR